VPDANVTGFLAPFLVLMAFNLLAAAFSDGFDWLYPAKVIATVLALVLFPQGWRMLRQPCEARGPIRFGGTWLPILNGVIVFAVWVGLVWDADGSRGMPEALRAAPPAMAVIWIIFRVFGSVITVPIVEELAFRGYLMRRLAVPDFASVPLRSVPFWCVAASSLAFGLMHQQWLAGILAGGAYAFAARSHNRLRDAVLAHAVTNGLIAFTVLSRDAWWLW
jgi:CAAX prenyl protease-like protein